MAFDATQNVQAKYKRKSSKLSRETETDAPSSEDEKEPSEKNEATASDSDKSSHSSDDDPGKEFEVELILADKAHDIVQHQFLVKWVGYKSKYNSWVNEADMNCSEKMATYWSLYPTRYGNYLVRKTARFKEKEKAEAARRRRKKGGVDDSSSEEEIPRRKKHVEDDLADFIVDDGDVEEQRQPRKKKRKQLNRKKPNRSERNTRSRSESESSADDKAKNIKREKELGTRPNPTLDQHKESLLKAEAERQRKIARQNQRKESAASVESPLSVSSPEKHVKKRRRLLSSDSDSDSNPDATKRAIENKVKTVSGGDMKTVGSPVIDRSSPLSDDCFAESLDHQEQVTVAARKPVDGRPVQSVAPVSSTSSAGGVKKPEKAVQPPPRRTMPLPILPATAHVSPAVARSSSSTTSSGIGASGPPRSPQKSFTASSTGTPLKEMQKTSQSTARPAFLKKPSTSTSTNLQQQASVPSQLPNSSGAQQRPPVATVTPSPGVSARPYADPQRPVLNVLNAVAKAAPAGQRTAPTTAGVPAQTPPSAYSSAPANFSTKGHISTQTSPLKAATVTPKPTTPPSAVKPATIPTQPNHQPVPVSSGLLTCVVERPTNIPDPRVRVPSSSGVSQSSSAHTSTERAPPYRPVIERIFGLIEGRKGDYRGYLVKFTDRANASHVSEAYMEAHYIDELLKYHVDALTPVCKKEFFT